jgi:hypothetical protein
VQSRQEIYCFILSFVQCTRLTQRLPSRPYFLFLSPAACMQSRGRRVKNNIKYKMQLKRFLVFFYHTPLQYPPAGLNKHQYFLKVVCVLSCSMCAFAPIGTPSAQPHSGGSMSYTSCSHNSLVALAAFF